MKPASAVYRGAPMIVLALAGLALPSTSPAQAGAAASTPVPATTAAPLAQPPAGTSAGGPNHYLPNRFAGRAGMYYKSVWGIDLLSVRWAESGELVRFTWRVLDPEKARLLNDKRISPSLEDPQSGVSLVVPVMEKVGQLRQSTPPEAGKSYWMAFSNVGRRVRRGDRVNVVIGGFRADNLVVD